MISDDIFSGKRDVQAWNQDWENGEWELFDFDKSEIAEMALEGITSAFIEWLYQEGLFIADNARSSDGEWKDIMYFCVTEENLKKYGNSIK